MIAKSLNPVSLALFVRMFALKLFVSPTTVRVHVSTVLRKLRVRDRESAFRLLREP